MSVNLTYRVTGKKVETTNYQPTGITPAEGEVESFEEFRTAIRERDFCRDERGLSGRSIPY